MWSIIGFLGKFCLIVILVGITLIAITFVSCIVYAIIKAFKEREE